MMLGWCLNTAITSYYYPRHILSLLFLYLGVNLLLTVAAYSLTIEGKAGIVLRGALGLTSYTPLDIVVVRLLEFNIPQEIFVICFIFLAMMISWAAGAVYGRLNPNPYSPRITGR